MLPGNDIILDCQGYEFVSARDPVTQARQDFFNMFGTQRLMVENCVFISEQDTSLPKQFQRFAHRDDNAHAYCFACKDLLFRNNVFQGMAHFRNVQQARIHSNTFYDGVMTLMESHGADVEHNIFRTPPNILIRTGAQLTVLMSDGTTVAHNTFDGGSQTLQMDDGQDNAIILHDSSRSIVRENVTQNHYGCAIEFVGNNNSDTVADNILDRAGVCGIGGWWWLSLQDANIERNVVSHSPTLFNLARANGLRANESHPYFINNAFRQNTLRDRAAIPQRDQGLATIIMYDRIHDEITPVEESNANDPERYTQPDRSLFEVYGNTFAGNSVGQTYPTLIMPSTLMQDGGMNDWRLCHDPAFCEPL